MERSQPNRRDFGKLTAAALGGLMAGSLAGCGKSEPKTEAKKGGKGDTENAMLSEPHVCKGLNTCKGNGKGGDNMCAGQGACFTAKEHACKGMNECKGQGGCGATAGQNACKGNGECAVKLKPETWKTARAKFEELMAKKEKKVGPAPE